MNPTETVAAAIAEHGRPYWVAFVPMNTVRQVPYPELVALLSTAPRHTTHDERTRTMLTWCDNNLFAEITVKEAAEMMGVSHPTAKKFILAHPHRFKFLKRGTYEVRAD